MSKPIAEIDLSADFVGELLPVPAPIRIGRPQGSYPWAWSIIPWIEGETADRAPLDSDPGTALAKRGFTATCIRETCWRRTVASVV